MYSLPFRKESGGKDKRMKLKVRYENEFQTIELDAKSMDEMWVSLSLEDGENLTQAQDFLGDVIVVLTTLRPVDQLPLQFSHFR